MSTPPSALLLCERLDIAGGVERFACELANHLAGQGWAVALGSLDTPREAVRYPLDPGVRVLCGPPERAAAAASSRLGRLWTMARHQLRLGRVLAAQIRGSQADVVLLNGLTTAASVLPRLRRDEAARVVCCDHNHFFARSRFWQWLRTRQYPRVAALVSLTQADAPRFARLHPVTRVIANASALQVAQVGAVEAPVVLAVGRHVAQKGFDRLLQAWARVRPGRPAAELRLIGDGPLLAAHQALAQQLGVADSVRFLPPTPAMAQAYRDSAVFVLPSRYEGMPLVLLEAQAMGLPAVAFDCPTGPADVIAPETGVLVPDGDIDGLARALGELLDDPARRQRLGAAAIERSQRLFSPQRHTQAWTTLLQAVARRTPVPEVLA
ncbi:glycosyltransferase family 4 protein [Ideonella alba]|uniref:Glycosyltransferase family 4 protein n=1 Tax=Ideonella alba TaxID=2824118 RepID=A0A940YBE7_9BURK|nr:glycosyltransferase family 4 protein [Ideonella alba]MBQ0929622.1 glycosyltransferase family 4 protein [Ideonella alba]